MELSMKKRIPLLISVLIIICSIFYYQQTSYNSNKNIVKVAGAFEEVPEDAAIEKADKIIIGKVKGITPGFKESYIDGANKERAVYFSKVDIEVLDVLKGDTNLIGTTITTTQLGGEEGNTLYEYENAPKYTMGKKFLLLLNDRNSLIGVNQGKFDFKDDNIVVRKSDNKEFSISDYKNKVKSITKK